MAQVHYQEWPGVVLGEETTKTTSSHYERLSHHSAIHRGPFHGQCDHQDQARRVHSKTLQHSKEVLRQRKDHLGPISAQQIHFLPHFQDDHDRRYHEASSQKLLSGVHQHQGRILAHTDVTRSTGTSKVPSGGPMLLVQSSTLQSAHRPADFYKGNVSGH